MTLSTAWSIVPKALLILFLGCLCSLYAFHALSASSCTPSHELLAKAFLASSSFERLRKSSMPSLNSWTNVSSFCEGLS
ncbi:hypothetical protein F4810DRAFT_686269, partial [Camillea tinctor]